MRPLDHRPRPVTPAPRRTAGPGNRRRLAWAGLATLLALLALGTVVVPAQASTADEQALAERFAPSVRLVQQSTDCGPGEPFQPSDVAAFLDNDEVALRGPWAPGDLIRVAPGADDLARGLDGYQLDFPGSPLDPGCDYESWARSATESTRPTVYAHVATEPGIDDRLALQYWFYYPFNDYNNKHEGDWEMIQLVFAASTPAQALRQSPVQIGYSQHEGSEVADWDDPKLETVGGTHPVVHVAAGSHANYYDAALFLGRSGEQGFGCDDTRSPAPQLPTQVEVIPRDPAAARAAFPWIAYRGQWGEQAESFYNAPTGPNTKGIWDAPITVQEERAHDQSYAVPASGLFGTQATDLFCNGVADGSDVVRMATDDLARPLLVLAVLLVVALVLIRGTTWRPTAPLRLGRRRDGGQILAAAARMYLSRWRTFVGTGMVTIPVFLVAAGVQSLLVDTPAVAGVPTGGEAGGYRVVVAGLITFALIGVTLVLVLAASARALVEVDAGQQVSTARAYRASRHHLRPLLGAFAAATAMVGFCTVSVLLLPLAVALVVAFALFVPVAELEGATALGSLRRSAALVRHRMLKVSSLLALSVLVALVAGPAVGMVVLLVTSAPFAVVNVFAGVAFAFLMPYIGLTMTYVYVDARIASETAPSTPDRAVLPAELDKVSTAAADTAATTSPHRVDDDDV